MTEIERIVDQMDRAFSGDAWHGPALMSLLEGTTAENASRHSLRGAHSVWELTLHIAAWKRIVAKRLRGVLVEITNEVDWPPVWDASEVEWRRALELLAETHARLREVADALPNDALSQKPEGSDESRYVLLHGAVQHDLYHAGQIAILKKAVG